MIREAFIRKWLGNKDYQYNEQCRDEMRDDLDLVIEAALYQTLVSGRVCPKCKSDAIVEYPDYKECRICGNVW